MPLQVSGAGFLIEERFSEAAAIVVAGANEQELLLFRGGFCRRACRQRETANEVKKEVNERTVHQWFLLPDNFVDIVDCFEFTMSIYEQHIPGALRAVPAARFF